MAESLPRSLHCGSPMARAYGRDDNALVIGEMDRDGMERYLGQPQEKANPKSGLPPSYGGQAEGRALQTREKSRRARRLALRYIRKTQEEK